MKKHLKSFLDIVRYFLLLSGTLLLSYASNLKISSKSLINSSKSLINSSKALISKSKYRKSNFYEKKKSIESDKLPPNLTDLNDNWKVLNKSITRNLVTDRIIQNAKEYLGVPYHYGGNSSRGIDCSALVKQAFEPYEFLPRISVMQAKSGISVAKNQLIKGDLLFFSMVNKYSRRRVITHVGIVLGKNGGNISFIHASRLHGVMISYLNTPYWNRRFVMGRRIIKDTYLKLTEFKQTPDLLIVN